MKIVPYKDKKTGKTLYKFYVYIGTDPLTGKSIRTNRQGFETKKQAEIAYLQLKSQKESLEKPKQYTFEQVYKMWLEHYQTTVKSSTLGKVKELFKNHILPELGMLFIGKINLKIAQNAVNNWNKKIKKYKDLKIYTQQVFKHAMRLELVDKDPFALVVMPKPKKSEIKLVDASENFYTKGELSVFLNLCKEQLPAMWYTLLHTLAYTGMRRGEILALIWKDIDFKTGRIRINKTLTLDENNKIIVNDTKTTAGERNIKIDTQTIQLLKAWKKEQMKQLKVIDINQLVFPNGKNKHMALSTPIKYLNRICDKNGLKRITLHGLRHTHCSLLFAAGASLKEVQDRLGHDDIKTTMDIYNHITKAQQENAVDKLINFMNATN